MDKKEVVSNLKKYIIFTTIVSLGVIAFTLGDDTDENNGKKVAKENINICLDVPSSITEVFDGALTTEGNTTVVNYRAIKYNNM